MLAGCRTALFFASGLLTFLGIGESKSPFRLVLEPVVRSRGNVLGVSSSSLKADISNKQR
jgi:hypothetical protein